MATIAAGRIVPNAVAITEWYSRIDGSIESCGQASVAMALHALKGTPATSSFVTQLSGETQAAKQTTDWPHASTSPNNLKWLFKQHGVTAIIHSGDWQTALQAFAGVKPLVLGVSNATAFGGHDAHIDGHYVCVFGLNTNGTYAVGDPNTPESTTGALVSYSAAQIHAAQPFAVLVPNESPLSSIPVIGGALDAAVSPVNQTILHVNGFSGIVGVINAEEHVSAPDVSSLADLWRLPGWVFSNAKAWLVRGIVIGIGLLLILAVLIQVIKQTDPDFWQQMSPAGQAQQVLGTVGMGGGGGAADGAEAGAGAGIPVEAAALA